MYTLLNSYYYGAQNATGNTYCYGYQSTAKAKCDYSYIGIKPSSYYGTMVKEVYWNTGGSHTKQTPTYEYADETSIQTMKGNVGIMSMSDYGFATSYNRPTRTTMSSYTTNYPENDWLYGKGTEKTLTPISANSNYTSTTNSNGYIYSLEYVYANNNVHPVVYLDPSLYVVSGDGSILNPYKIAWPSSS
jgi:hypothetical protein